MLVENIVIVLAKLGTDYAQLLCGTYTCSHHKFCTQQHSIVSYSLLTVVFTVRQLPPIESRRTEVIIELR